MSAKERMCQHENEAKKCVIACAVCDHACRLHRDGRCAGEDGDFCACLRFRTTWEAKP